MAFTVSSNQYGLSLIEVIVSMAIFSLIAASMTTLVAGGFTALDQGGKQSEAAALADEGIEAVRAIRDAAWNEFIYTTSSVSTAAGWQFDGEGTIETIGDFTRIISFTDVCRDASGTIVTCPSGTVDIHTTLVTASVTWQNPVGGTNSVERIAYMSNWEGGVFTQTDWSGGSGQSIWSSDSEYESDDGNIDVSAGGQVSLASLGGDGCGNKVWGFESGALYTFDAEAIEVTGGNAQLRSQGPSGWADNSYLYRRSVSVKTGMNAPSGGYDGYTVQIDGLDTATLINAGKMNSDCSDLRIFFDTGTPVEIDRRIIDCNTGDTEIHFALQAHIADEVTISETYFMYYGDSSATSGPAELNNVYLWHDDAAEDKSKFYDFGRCDAWHGTGYTEWTYDKLNAWYDIDTGDNFTGCFRYPTKERDIYIEADFYHTTCYPTDMTSGLLARYILGSGLGSTEDSNNYYATTRAHNGKCSTGYSSDGDIVKGSRTATVVDGINPEAIATEQWRKQGLAVWGANPTSVSFWDTDKSSSYDIPGFPEIKPIASGQENKTDLVQGGAVGIIAAQDTVAVKNILFRRYTSPEPSISLGIEEEGASYADDEPAIYPTIVHAPASVDAWTSFVEVADKNGGEVYYQLSPDGTFWYYWNGSNWASAGPDDYNTASTINTHIGSFTTSSGISFKAFLSGDGSQQVELDSVQISCQQEYNWSFADGSNYSFNTTSIEVSGGLASLVATGGGSGSTEDAGFDRTSDTSHAWPFTTSSNYTYEASAIDISGGVAQLVPVTSTIGGLGDNPVASYEYDTSDSDRASMVHVSGDVYAIAYNGPGTDGWIKTVAIDSTGNISGEIDSYEYETSQSRFATIVHATNDVYAVVYQGPSNDGWLKTIDIETDGTINGLLDSEEFDTGNGREPDIIQVSPSMYAIAYRGSGNDGFVITHSIDGSGTISNSSIDTLEFDTSNGYQPDIIHVSGDYYAIAYRGSGNDGFISTVTITSAGMISNSVVDTEEFDTNNATFPHPMHISGDVYAIVYEGPGNDGWLATITINESGAIGNVITSYEFNSSYSNEPRLRSVGSGYYLVVYENSAANGIAALYTIDDSGSNITYIDSMVFDDASGQEPFPIELSQNYFAIAYDGPNGDGWLTTIQVTEDGVYPTTAATIAPASVHVVSGVQSWDSFTEIASKESGEIYYQLSPDGGTTWQYWNGSSWATISTTTDRNTASVVHTNIGSFATSSQQLLFRAYLISDGTSQVSLDDVSVAFTPTPSVWSYSAWSGNPTTSEQSMGGNPDGYVDITAPLGFFGVDGGLYEQAVLISEDNAEVSIDFDYRVFDANGSPITAEVRVYLDTTSGSPITQVGNSIAATSEGVWTSANTIDASSVASTAGMYYLKIALWVQHGFFSGPFTVGFDNVSLEWSADGYPTNSPTISPSTTFIGTGVSTWNSFDVVEETNGGSIYYQLSADGSTWLFWNGAAWTTSTEPTDYSSSSTVATYITAFPTSTSELSFRAFLVSDGSQAVTLDDVSVTWGEESGAGSGYATDGYLVSSAFDMGDNSPVQSLSWSETAACAPTCYIRAQVRTAPDNDGSPGTWTDWYGASGSGTYFTNPADTLIPTTVNFNQWLQYRIELVGDGTNTPTLEDIMVNYK